MTPENKERLEEQAMNYLEMARDMNDDESKEMFNRGVKILEKIREADETEFAAENQAERVTVEREKIDAQERMEQEKQRIPWMKIAWDLGKAAIVVGVPTLVTYALSQQTMELEEHGTVKTQARRGLLSQSPKLFNNIPKI